MPMERDRYPENWEEIALKVKEQADWCCQDCGRKCRKPGESLFDFIDRLVGGNWRDNCELWSTVADHPQRWTLTTAHLDQNPGNNAPGNLKALCAPCHLRHDRPFRQLNRRLKSERRGQLNLFALTPPEPAGQGKDSTRIQLPINHPLGDSSMTNKQQLCACNLIATKLCDGPADVGTCDRPLCSLCVAYTSTFIACARGKGRRSYSDTRDYCKDCAQKLGYRKGGDRNG